MPVLRRFAMLAITFQEALPPLSLLSRLTSGFFAVVRPANAFPIVFMQLAAKHQSFASIKAKNSPLVKHSPYCQRLMLVNTSYGPA